MSTSVILIQCHSKGVEGEWGACPRCQNEGAPTGTAQPKWDGAVSGSFWVGDRGRAASVTACTPRQAWRGGGSVCPTEVCMEQRRDAAVGFAKLLCHVTVLISDKKVKEYHLKA